MSERSRRCYAVIMLREGIGTLTALLMALPLPSDFLFLSVLPVSFHPSSASPHSSDSPLIFSILIDLRIKSICQQLLLFIEPPPYNGTSGSN